MSKVILIDGRNMCYRAHFTHSRLSSKKRPTSVIYGVPNMLLSMQRKLRAPVIFCWDGEGPTWRHELTKGKKKEYKANRQMNEIRSLVTQQIPVVKDILRLLGIWSIEIANLEADDLIGIISTYLTEKYAYCDQAVIYSGDRDFLQLVSDKISVWVTQGRNKTKFMTPKMVEKQWGVTPGDYKRMRALCGDKGDNISNVIKGIGSKTAAKLVAKGLDASYEDFSDLPDEVVKQYADKFKEIWPMVHENYKLCKIVTRPKDSNLPRLIQNKATTLLRQLSFSGVERGKKESCRELIELFVQYDLDDHFGNRKAFFDIP